MAASYAVSVRQASVLLSASFRFHLAMDTLAVQLVIPLTGLTEDSHLQVILPAPPVQKQLPSGRYAPCPAHHKKSQDKPGFRHGVRVINHPVMTEPLADAGWPEPKL